MGQKITWMHRHTPRVQVARRRCKCQSLEWGPDRDSDHVLRQMLAVADPSVAANGDDIDEPVFHHKLDPDLWKAVEEAIDQRR